MEKQVYKTKEGKEGVKYVANESTKVRILFAEPKVWENGNGSLLVTANLVTPLVELKDQDKVYLSLTQGQVKGLQTQELEIGDTIVGHLYTVKGRKNQYRKDGKFVGLKKA